MGTYSQPGRIIDKSLSGLTEAGDVLSSGARELSNQQKIVRQNRLKRENAINEQLRGASKAISKIQGPTVTATTKIQEMLSSQLDQINKLGKASIGGDNSEFLNALTQFETAIESVPNMLGTLNDQSEQWKKSRTISEGQVGAYLNSTPTERIGFMDDITDNDGANIDFSYENGQIILDYQDPNNADNKFTLNGREYLKEYKDGRGDIVKFVEDKSDVLGKVWKSYASDYKPLQEKIQQDIKDGKSGTSITTTLEKWAEADKAMREKLSQSDQVRAAIDESTFQQLGLGDEAWTGSENQVNRATEALVDKMMNQYGQSDRTTAIAKDLMPTEYKIDPKSDREKAKEESYNTAYSELEKKANSVLNIVRKQKQGTDFVMNLKDKLDENGKKVGIPQKYKKLYEYLSPDTEGAKERATKVQEKAIYESIAEGLNELLNTKSHGVFIGKDDNGEEYYYVDTGEEGEIIVDYNNKEDLIELFNRALTKPLDLYKKTGKSSTGTGKDVEYYMKWAEEEGA